MTTAEQPLRVVLAGYGLAGEVLHAPLIATTDGLRIVAAVTRDPERRARLAVDHPGARVVDTLDEALPDADLVVVVAPNRFHVALATAALDAGCHLVVDKPLAVTSAEAAELTRRAEVAGRVLAPFHNRRWDDDILTVARLMAEGRLGRVLRVESRFDRWRPAIREGAWREAADPVDGGGLLLDLGTHLVDQAVQLLGRVVRVYAERDVRRPGAAVDDDVFLALEHAGGARSHLWAGVHAAHPPHRLRVLGDRATYVTEGLDPQEAALKAGVRPGDGGLGVRDPEDWGRLYDGTSVQQPPMEPGRWADFYAGVVEAVRYGGPAPVTGAQAVSVLELLEAARESARTNTVISVV